MKRSSIETDKKIEDNIIKDVRNLFRLKKYIIIRGIMNHFEHEEKDYNRPVIVRR